MLPLYAFCDVVGVGVGGIGDSRSWIVPMITMIMMVIMILMVLMVMVLMMPIVMVMMTAIIVFEI